MKILYSILFLLLSFLITSCASDKQSFVNEHGIVEFHSRAIARVGVEVKLIKSPNPPAMYQMWIRPVGNGLAHWSSSEKGQRVAMWQEVVKEECGERSVTIVHGPDATGFAPEYCTPDPGETDCGLASITGDFICVK